VETQKAYLVAPFVQVGAVLIPAALLANGDSMVGHSTRLEKRTEKSREDKRGQQKP
jgi:hypothetical protein